MITVNMYGGAQGWWNMHRQKVTGANAKYVAPNACVFCNRKIQERDYFYVGYTEPKIFAETCDDIKCHQWLKWKARLKKISGKDYKKELEDRAKKQE